MTNEQKKSKFIKKAVAAHPNENLDYSQVIYVNSKTPVEIIDHDLRPDGSEYGSYWQAPENHVRGQGHPDKRGCKISASKSESQDEIIRRFKEAHKNENLDYSQVVYVNMHTKVKIISHDLRPDGTEYGEFWQEPIAHIRGCTHPGIKKRGRNKSFVNTCASPSRAKDFFSNFQGMEVDENNVVIAGRYGINYVALVENDRRSILDKCRKYSKSGITLLNVFEDEYVENKGIVLEKINHILGKNKSLPVAGARKCQIREVTKKDAKQFLNMFHIQGFAGASIYYGAFYNNEIVGVMSFINDGNGCWNLNRFATNINYSFPGLASKIFKRFVKENNPVLVKSFLDRRWCFNENENLYTKLGFVQDKVLSPDYRYTNGHGERLHKFRFRKQILHKKYGLPLTMTESEMTKSLGYYKIWDCGLIRYIWTSDKKSEA